MDKILYALLALCAIIIVFATAVTLVQALYFKLIQTRRDGMMTLLRSIYRDAVEARLKQAGLHDPKLFDARHRDRFALDMTVNRAFPEKGVRKVLSDQPILRRYWGARVESMSTRQFAEHLAGTDVGERIVTLPPEQLKGMLREFAYEFERMGELQIRTFKTKVGVQTVIIGIVLAFLFNVDMLRTFKALSADSDLAQQVSVLMLAGIQDPNVAAAADAARQSIDEAGVVVAPDAPPTDQPAPEAAAEPAEPAAPAASSTEARAITNQAAADAVAKVLAKANADSAMFGLPIGYAGYPYCQPVVTGSAVAGALGGGAAKLIYEDDRCESDGAGEVDALAVGVGAYQALFGPGKEPDKAKANAGHLQTFMGRLLHKSGVGVVWFFSVVFAGACFGLGAPFWFDIFNRLSTFAASRGIAQLTPRKVDGAESAMVQGPPPTAVRAKHCVTPEELLDAFVISARSNGIAGAWSQPVTRA